jgi:hypothetical protein
MTQRTEPVKTSDNKLNKTTSTTSSFKADKSRIAEDAADNTAFEKRVNEPLISYDEMVKRLKINGLI